MEQYIKVIHITDETTEDSLYYVKHQELGIDDDFVEVNEIREGNPNVVTTPIRIDKILDMLTGMVRKGCTHVAMDYHCDHDGYDFSGFEIRCATGEEALEHIKKENLQKELENRKTQLRKELAELERVGIENIKKDFDDLPF